jgi:hypothetical protein
MAYSFEESVRAGPGWYCVGKLVHMVGFIINKVEGILPYLDMS